jgi:DNA-directed RNA polymerase III subunit RPC1
MERWKRTFAPAVEAQKELGMYLNKAVHEDLNPLKTLDLFKRISDEVRSLRFSVSDYAHNPCLGL